MTCTALIIDDESDIRELLQITLSRMDIDCTCVGDLSSARTLLDKQKFDICLTDMEKSYCLSALTLATRFSSASIAFLSAII